MISVTLPVLCAPLWLNEGMAVTQLTHPVRFYFKRQLSVITWYELGSVFDFRSFMDLRTKWARTTGGASPISSPCHWRSGWQPFMGCNCSTALCLTCGVSSLLEFHVILWKNNWKNTKFCLWYQRNLCVLIKPLFHTQVINYGRQHREPLLPREHDTLYREGVGGYKPLPDLMEMGWEGGGSCSALCPCAQARGGTGLADQPCGRKIHLITSQSKITTSITFFSQILPLTICLFSVWLKRRHGSKRGEIVAL